MKKPLVIPSILVTLRHDLKSGRITIEQATEELHRAGWMNYLNEERARELLSTND